MPLNQSFEIRGVNRAVDRRRDITEAARYSELVESLLSCQHVSSLTQVCPCQCFHSQRAQVTSHCLVRLVISITYSARSGNDPRTCWKDKLEYITVFAFIEPLLSCKDIPE